MKVEMLPDMLDNPALDIALLCLIAVGVARYVLRGTKGITNATKATLRANTLRKTLELKANEVASLRQSLARARKKTSANLKPYLEDLESRASLAGITGDREPNLKHQELEQQLEQAAKRAERDA
jgi:hypothetical protein